MAENEHHETVSQTVSQSQTNPDYLCICGEGFENNKRFSIQCDECKEWYHGKCVNIEEYAAEEIDRFHCSKCRFTAGPSIPKTITNCHRHNRTDPDAQCKPVQSGTAKFVEQLKSRSFGNANEVIDRLRGQQLTFSYLVKNGFDSPILVEYNDGLELVVPPSESFTYEKVMEFIGSDYVLDVIDVTRQMNIKMNMSEFVKYFNIPYDQRHDIFNCISLEVSETPLNKEVKPPDIVTKLSWVDNYWPKTDTKPAVSKYCLMSMKDSYTDFHIDFGGTTVWYHVVKGEKLFFLIRPNHGNLMAYEQWMGVPNSSEIFLGETVDACYTMSLSQGQTLFIPTGWIHAVLTPIDSIVFGGNFLHSLCIPLQLEIYEMEQRIKTPEKFKFPNFELTHWYAAPMIVKLLQDNLSMRGFPSKHLVNGVKSLIIALKNWIPKRVSPNDYDNIIFAPKGFNCQKVIKDLSKVLKHAERILNGQPPVKRRRKL